MERYKLLLSGKAEAVVEKIRERDSKLFFRIASVFDSLQENPFQGKPLGGDLKGQFSYRIGSYRILYSVFKNQLVVLVIDIGHRRDIYR